MKEVEPTMHEIPPQSVAETLRDTQPACADCKTAKIDRRDLENDVTLGIKSAHEAALAYIGLLGSCTGLSEAKGVMEFEGINYTVPINVCNRNDTQIFL